MSAAARRIQNAVYDHENFIIDNPDRKLLDWTDAEFKLFRALEYARYGDMITHGFPSVEDFINTANIVLNRRKAALEKS